MTRICPVLLACLLFISIQGRAQSPPPVIEYFSPREGHGGEVLIIQGRNFPATTNDLLITFCSEFYGGQPVEILDTSPTTIAVKVPTNGWSLYGASAQICVWVNGEQDLGHSTEQFRFLPPPEITSVRPSNVVLPGGLLEVRGRNFRGEAGFYRALIDGVANAIVELASEEALLVSLPPILASGPHQLSIRLHDALSNPMTFNVVQPKYSIAGSRTNGLSIRVTKADFSNTPDGEISLLEAVLIANGNLGRAIEQHLPCETLPPDDPGKCPPQRRESDMIQNLDTAPNGGPNSADFVFLDSSITNGTEVFGVLPPLTTGDAYALPIILNGQGAPAGTPGLDLNHAGHVSVSGLTLRNYPGHGVWLRSNAFFNSLSNIKIENCGRHGVFLDGDARENRLFGLSVSNAALNGLYLSGTNVWLNRIEASGGRPPLFGGETVPFSHFMKCAGNGIRVENGARLNIIAPGTVRENTLSGILVQNPGTEHNLIGRISDEAFRAYDVVKNGLQGVRLTGGVRYCVVRYINASGNERDGIMLDTDVTDNQVDRCSVGANLYEGGTSLDLPNQGSGIHLLNGARYNLIGSHIVSFGDLGTICGNRDDGILIEGADTAYNTVCAQQIGLHSLEFAPFVRARFVPNGKSGIRLRGGTHDNFIGEWQYELPNRIFASREAAVMIEGNSTRNNQVTGNQIGSYHQEFNPGVASENYIGVWIRDGASSNSVGWAGSNVEYSRFGVGPPDTGKFFWNVITRCWVGVLIESTNGAAACVGNTIRNNLIGEEEAGGLAQGATGVKIGYGALRTDVGGFYPSYGNRIRGNWRAGIWIVDNHADSANSTQIQNNYIAEHGFNGFLRYPEMLTSTPSGGVGLLVENSSGHQLGVSLDATNIFEWNRIGVYLANSSSNLIYGNYISNQFLAGVIVRGGTGNQIGYSLSYLGNIISGYGLGDRNHAGIALSETSYNTIENNYIGNYQGRAGMGVFITNAFGNSIGHPDGFAGSANEIVKNTNGVVISRGDYNGVYGNYIGVSYDGIALTNNGDGIRIENGSIGNLIGATNAPNYIWYNQVAGVRVDGSGSWGNQILDNSITQNGSRGIVLSDGGNYGVRAPRTYRFDGTNFSGTVDLGEIPEGTLIQVFCDPAPTETEGDVYLGEGYVEADGTWRAPLIAPLAHPFVSLTATHPDLLGLGYSTSEFGGFEPLAPLYGFAVARAPANLATNVAPGSSAPVFALSLFASNTVVRVNSISFGIAGSLPDVASVVNASLHHDVNGDGRLSAGDVYLAGPAQFTAEDGRVTFTTTNAVIDANATERWLLLFDLASDAPVGSKFRLSLTNSAAVDATFVYPPNVPATALGIFPIESPEFTIGEPTVRQTIGAWKQTVFTAAQLADPNTSGDKADPDGDGYNNVIEYAFNLDPLVADRTASSDERGAPRPVAIRLFNPGIGAEQDYFGVEFIRRKPPVDLNYHVRDSLDLLSWTDSEQTGTETVGDGTRFERVTYRAAQPQSGPGAAPQQFIHVQVELLP